MDALDGLLLFFVHRRFFRDPVGSTIAVCADRSPHCVAFQSRKQRRSAPCRCRRSLAGGWPRLVKWADPWYLAAVMETRSERRTSTQLAEHLPAIEQFARFVHDAAPELRSEQAGAALSNLLSTYAHFAVMAVALNRPLRGFPYVDAHNEDDDERNRWAGELLPKIESAWRKLSDKELILPEFPAHTASGQPPCLASFIVQPLRFGDEILGVMAIGSRRKAAFGVAERSMLKLAAGQMAVILYNEHLFASVEAMNQDILEAQEQQQDLSLLTQYSSAAVIGFEQVANGDTFVTSWNEGARKLFGYYADEMLYVPNALDRLHLAGGGDAEDVPLWKRTEPTTVGKEVSYCDKDGRTIHLIGTIVALRGAPEEAQPCLAIFENISAQIETQHSLEQALEALERKNLELERFARVVSHDLKNPLGLIRGYAELLSEGVGDKLDAFALPFLTSIQDQAERMTSFVESLLAYARTGSTEPVLERISMHLVVQVAIGELTYQLHEAGAEVDILRELPEVNADETQITQVWRNLLGNAVKYRHPDRLLRLTVEWEDRGDHTHLFHLHDNGLGIPVDQRDRIFDLYHRVDDNRTVDSTGIGLAVVKRIIEQHGGTIWVRSEVDTGSTFSFTLPSEDEDGN